MKAQVTTYCLDGLCCAEEERLLEKRLQTLQGVEKITCNVISKTVVVVHTCSQENILHSLKEIGFAPRLYRRPDETATWWQRQNQLMFIIFSGSLLFLGIIFQQTEAGSVLWIPLFAASILSGGWRIGIKALRGIRHGSLDMNVLMAIATIGAAIIGQWTEGAAVIVLFSGSQLLEHYSMDRARTAIRSLMDLSPPTASVIRDGIEIRLTIDQVRIGDHVLVRPGERIPIDGIVVEGDSMVDQSPITGESLPVRKQPQDGVYAGTLNGHGKLHIRTTKHRADSMLAQIVHLVEKAQSERAPIQHFVERFARYYSPAVIGIAVILSGAVPIIMNEPFGVWFYRSLVMLVIACPCALVISTPVTMLSGLSHAAREGILIKGGRYLEEIGKIDAIAFDKTGTVTEGVPQVTDIIPLNSLSPERILQLAAIIEIGSEHHFADAVMKKARDNDVSIDTTRARNFKAISGRGVTAEISHISYVVGNHALIEEWGICTPKVESELQRLESEGKTGIVLGTSAEVLGIIAIADTPRSDAASMIRRLHSRGIGQVVMITGDNDATAQKIGQQFGFDGIHANVLPHEKVNHIKQLQQSFGRVAMVGDGINDAPALAISNVGIAMGVSGTDVAMETASIVLMSDDLGKIPYLISLSRKTLSIIKQNVFIALVTKLIFVGLGITGIASLWLAVLADDGATLLVIINGLRVLRKIKR